MGAMTLKALQGIALNCHQVKERVGDAFHCAEVRFGYPRPERHPKRWISSGRGVSVPAVPARPLFPGSECCLAPRLGGNRP
jgi:hypothetical protein